MKERQLQDGLCAYLRKNKLSFVRNRMDKKSCIREGWPDITVIHCGRAWLCETKTATGKLSAKQKEVIAELQANGTPVTVARSVEEAIGSLEAWMGVVRGGESVVSHYGPSVSDRDIAAAMGALLDQKDLSRSHQPHTNESTEPVEHAGTTQSGDLSQNLFIATFGGELCVFRGNSKPGGLASLVRLATAADLINLKRR